MPTPKPKILAVVINFLLSVSSDVTILQAQQAPPPAYSTDIKTNYVRTWDATAPEQNAATLITRPLNDVKQTTQYLDGLGKPFQTVVKQGSLVTGGTAVDFISTLIMDEFGREKYNYAAFASTANDATKNDGSIKQNPFHQQATFMNQQFGAQAETWFYGQTNFEASPLNRPEKSMPQGNSWIGSGKGVATKYYNNTTVDAVRKWTVSVGVIPAFSTYNSTSGAYSAGELYKTIIEDENGKQSIEFKDKEGKIVLKKMQLTAAADDGSGSGHNGWLCTYYMYDDLNNLRCVIQPRGVELIAPTWTLTDAVILAEQCFRYEYDKRNRLVVKKVPGAGEIYMVFDWRDRLVMTQDANLRSSNNWIVTLYDDLNRPVQTGLLLNTYFGATPKSFVQHAADAYNSSGYPFTASTTPSVSHWEYLTKTGYDTYATIPVASGLTNTFDGSWSGYFNSTYNSTPLYAQQQTASLKTNGMVTWTVVKVLGTSTYLYSVPVYDNKGRTIQIKGKNFTGGIDIITTQYNWIGQPLITIEKREKAGAPTQTMVIISQMTYDDLGRPIKTEKKLSNSLHKNNAMSAYVTVSTLEYDALGQLKKKAIGSKKDAGSNLYISPRVPLQELNYDYNIRGWLLGMNRDYLATEGQTSDGKYFGFEMGYDKLTNKTAESFNAIQLNGNISGMIWKSDGDDIRRKYDFGYDAVNRLLKADFEQQNAEDHAWNNSKVNYSVKMGDGVTSSLAYDANGNIKRMQQWGLKKDGISGQIDDLTYNYMNAGYSNKLQNVADGFNDNQTILGDFRVSALNPSQTKTSTTVDYTYDINGNMVKDLNKDLGTMAANGVVYNYLNLPQIITVYKSGGAIKGTITYTYDAAGNKLKKVTQENNATVPYNGTNYTNVTMTTTTSYISGAVYETKTHSNSNLAVLQYVDKLQFTGHEEGRIRPLYDNAASPATITDFAYDYFIKDHLGNVRMVLTDEVKTILYPAATLEGTYDASTNSMVNYEKQFYKINAARITAETSIPSWAPETVANSKQYYNNNGNPPSNLSYPAGCAPIQTDGSTKLYQLNATINKTGLEFMIKVMAGDKVDIMGKSYYLNTSAVNNANSTPLDLLTLLANFLSAPGNAAAGKGFTATSLNTLNAGLVPSTFFRGTNNESPTTTPKAYINYIFFDEQFKYAGGNFSRVGVSGSLKDHWFVDAQLQNITAPKNGYIFVYVSNESNMNVFFDNLQVIHKPGPLLEETHYYPFGLTMVGISSNAAGKLDNRFEYNGIEHNVDFDLNIYDAFFRNLDPQTGRFCQIDPITSHSKSPYESMGNNPIKNMDWLGDYFKWGPGASEDTYSKLRQENCGRMEDYMNELGGLDLNSDNKKVQKRIGQLKNLINAHAELTSQWDEMEASDVEFNVTSDMPSPGAGGDAKYNMDEERVNIRLGKNDKDFNTMAHEFRHGYGYLNGEMVGGGPAYDIMDEVVAANAGFLFLDKSTAADVADGMYNLKWFKDYRLNTPFYEHLVGKEVQITTNTTAAVYLKYFDPKFDRIAHMMNINKNNANYSVQNAINDLNAHAAATGRQPEFRSGALLKNR